jgi:hypothetical protein
MGLADVFSLGPSSLRGFYPFDLVFRLYGVSFASIK